MLSKKVLVFQPKAEEDLELIFSYTESTWGIEQAEKYVDSLYNSIAQLLKYPEMGTKYMTSTTEYRKIVVHRHIAYYRISNYQVIVVRILHSKMNRNNWLN